MSLSDTAEYWQDVKSYRGYFPNGFRHAKGLNCGHNHNVETEYFKDVDCHSCKKIINKNRPENLLDGDAPEFYYLSKTYAKKMRRAKKEREEFNNENGICECGSDWKIRFNRIKNQHFLGCSDYPKCKKTKSIINIILS